MSLNNDVRLAGFCAEGATRKETKFGTAMAVLVIYTQEPSYGKQSNQKQLENMIRGKGNTIDQAHRCVFFGNKVDHIVKKASKGRHIQLRGTLRSQRVGEGVQARYYTSVLVEEYRFSPRQNVEALQDVVREIIAENE